MCHTTQLALPIGENHYNARIQCELREMVQDTVEGKAIPNGTRMQTFLLNWNMDVLIAMQIDVNESGGLTPMLAYINPMASFTFGASGTLSEARQHTFTQNLQYSLRQIYLDWYAYNLAKKAGLDPGPLGLTAHECPPGRRHQSGRDAGDRGFRGDGLLHPQDSTERRIPTRSSEAPSSFS